VIPKKKENVDSDYGGGLGGGGDDEVSKNKK